MVEWIHRWKEPILYVVFGILTTVVNILVYYVASDVIQMHYLYANGVAWLVSVLFAFVTNKLFVFKSRSWRCRIIFAELVSFLLARTATGVMDMTFMWLLVDIVSVDEMLAKVGVNVLVIVLNYVASKLWIFK